MIKRSFRACATIAGLIERTTPSARKSGRQATFSAAILYDCLDDNTAVPAPLDLPGEQRDDLTLDAIPMPRSPQTPPRHSPFQDHRPYAASNKTGASDE